MAMPTQLFLELSEPMSYLQSQALHFLSPGVQAILRRESYETYSEFARLLERRGAVAYLRSRIDELEAERAAGSAGGGDAV